MRMKIRGSTGFLIAILMLVATVIFLTVSGATAAVKTQTVQTSPANNDLAGNIVDNAIYYIMINVSTPIPATSGHVGKTDSHIGRVIVTTDCVGCHNSKKNGAVQIIGSVVVTNYYTNDMMTLAQIQRHRHDDLLPQADVEHRRLRSKYLDFAPSAIALNIDNYLSRRHRVQHRV